MKKDYLINGQWHGMRWVIQWISKQGVKHYASHFETKEKADNFIYDLKLRGGVLISIEHKEVCWFYL